MFYLLAKLGWLVVAPSHLFVIGACIGLLIARLRPRLGWTLAASCLALLLSFMAAPVGDALIAPLENRFPLPRRQNQITGLIVLGGATAKPLSPSPDYEQPSDAGDRLFQAARLAKAYPMARVLVSGGNADRSRPPEADAMARFLAELGVAPGRIEKESRSRDTFENASFSKSVAHPRPGERWLLVTSAFHMPRAIGCFRKAGFEVIAAPADWRRGREVSLMTRSGSANLQLADLAAKEYLGLLIYRLTGRTSTLFPRP